MRSHLFLLIFPPQSINLMLWLYLSQRPLPDLGLTLWLSLSDLMHLAVGSALTGALLLPLASAAGVIDARGVWGLLSQRVLTEWGSAPWNQVYLAVLLFALVALPQVSMQTSE